jgi:hypothetical protein
VNPIRAISSADPYLGLAAAALWDARAAVELELVSAILSDPARGMAYATDTGLSPHHFAAEDAQLIYCACEVGPRWDVGAVLRLARLALWDGSYWDSHAPSHTRGPLWSDASLANLATSYPGPGMVPHLARQLIDLYQRLHIAQACLRRARRLLTIQRARVALMSDSRTAAGGRTPEPAATLIGAS